MSAKKSRRRLFTNKIKKMALLRVSFSSVLVLFSSVTEAQAADGISVGQTRLSPSISIEYFGDTNVYAADSNESETTGVRLRPRITWSGENRNSQYELGYLGNISRTGIEEVDEEDHQLKFSVNSVFSKRSQALAELTLSQETQPIGQGISIGTGDTLESLPVQSAVELRAQHTYGAQGARGNLTTGLEIRNLTFSGDEFLALSPDYSTLEPYVRFTLRLAGSTRAIAEVRHRVQEFADSGLSDRDRTSLLGGIEWDKSERFGGTAKIGILNYSSEADDGRDLALEAGIYFLPVDFSRFELTVVRDLFALNDQFELSGTNDEVTISDTVAVDWNHTWSNRVRHRANVELEVLERACSNDNQADLTTSFDVFITVRNWVGIGAGFTSETRAFEGCTTATGEAPNLDFTRNQFRVFVNLSL